MCSWDETKARLESVNCHSVGNSSSLLQMQLEQCIAVLGENSRECSSSDNDAGTGSGTKNDSGITITTMHLNQHQLMKEMQESSRSIRESLQAQIDHERQAIAEESDDLYMIVQQSNELQSQLLEYVERIAQLEEAKEKLRASIHHHKLTASKQTEEMDQVELDRMHQVPKIKNQISLYAKTTGIKWDYHRDHVLAGQVVSILCACI